MCDTKPVKDAVVSLAKRLISIYTPPENKEELKKAINLVKGVIPSQFDILELEWNKTKSLFVYKGDINKPFKLILTCHLDIIPSKINNPSPVIEGDKLYGPGANDMKGALAAAVFAFINSKAADVDNLAALQIVTDEEIGGLDGAKRHYTDLNIRAEIILATEPTSMNIAHAAKGILQADIICSGRSAHSAYPWKGENAIVSLINTLNKLIKQIPNPKKSGNSSTLNIASVFSSNKAYNKIPDHASASIDVRFSHEQQNHVREYLKKALDKNCEIKEKFFEAPLYTNPEHYSIKLLQDVTKKRTGYTPKLYTAQGTSDARFANLIGAVGFEFGPTGGGMAEDVEWVSISSLVMYHDIIKKYILELSKTQ